MREFRSEQLDDLAFGAAVLGTGGGGNPYVGTLLARQAIEEHGPIEWMLLNFEANVQVDLTSVDALGELLDELEERGIRLALARVKHDMHEQLDQAGLIDRIGDDHIFDTLPTAVVAYVDFYTTEHGEPPPGIVPPPPPEPPIIES